MAARSARLTPGALALASALALGGVGAARAVGASDTRTHEAAAKRSAQGTARAFDAAAAGVTQSVGLLVVIAPDVLAHPATPPAALAGLVTPNGVSGIVLVPPTMRGASIAAGALPAGVTPDSIATAMRSALDVSRDTGDVHAAAAGAAAGVAVPVYARRVISTEDRRQSTAGWVVAVVDPRTLLASSASATDHMVLRVSGTPVTPVAARGRFAAETTVTVGATPWQLVVTPEAEGGTAPFSWPLVFAGLVAAAAVLLVGARSARALERLHVANDALERETRTVAELGPILQQSLDLAEVLPAVSIRLSDEFALDGFAVELLGEYGELVDVFAVGRRSSGAEPYVITGTEPVDAGVEAALPLLRAGRTIGRLRLIPRETLLTSQVDSLRGAADLIAVATYNVELYEREQATVRRLQELDRLKDAFLGTISHELRTPITAITGFVRMLNDRWHDLSEEQRRDFLRRVGRNSTSLGLLVDDLLDFARLERQALSTSVSPISLDTIVGSFIAQVVPALGDHAVDTDLEPGVLAIADPRAIERVLANLLTNAAKFSPPATPLEVALHRSDGMAVLSVGDHGPGIAEEDRLRVFTRFYRGESEAARKTRGAGIGLAVVHELITQMGGDIEVHGRNPHGTVMVVRLPLAAPATPGPRAAADDRVPARSTP